MEQLQNKNIKRVDESILNFTSYFNYWKSFTQTREGQLTIYLDSYFNKLNLCKIQDTPIEFSKELEGKLVPLSTMQNQSTTAEKDLIDALQTLVYDVNTCIRLTNTNIRSSL
jgi:hypothetical protein